MIKSILRLGLFLLVLGPNLTLACTCVGTHSKTAKPEYKAADLVAAGTVINVERIILTDSTEIKKMIRDCEMLGIPFENTNNSRFQQAMNRVTIEVETIYKGQLSNDTLIIYTGHNAVACGYWFENNHKYIIYCKIGMGNNNYNYDAKYPHTTSVFSTSRCSRTQAFNKKEIKLLKRLKSCS